MSKISLIPFGLLVKPHGLKGYISVRFFNKDSRLLKKEDRVFFENDINSFLTIKDINYNSKNNCPNAEKILRENYINIPISLLQLNRKKINKIILAFKKVWNNLDLL